MHIYFSWPKMIKYKWFGPNRTTFCFNCDVTCASKGQVTGISTVCSTHIHANHKEIISDRWYYWPFLRGIDRWPVDSPHKRSVTDHDVIMGAWPGALIVVARVSANSWPKPLSNLSADARFCTKLHSLPIYGTQKSCPLVLHVIWWVQTAATRSNERSWFNMRRTLQPAWYCVQTWHRHCG